MNYLALILALFSLLDKLTDYLARQGLIKEMEAALARRVLSSNREMRREAREAADSVRADIRAGRLRDDDGKRRK